MFASTDRVIFISYSRAQREFAEKLYTNLIAAGYTVLRDLHDLKGGDDWWRQLQEMIDQSEWVVLCLSPEAVHSENVMKEVNYARALGRSIIPIVAAEVDFKSLPGWLQRAHSFDLQPTAKERELSWSRFIAQLNQPVMPRRVPFMVDNLPADFIARQEEFDAVIEQLIDEMKGAVAITAAIRGAGGFGKTTLARAICHHPRVREAFDDGILWITLGDDPGNLTDKLLDLVLKLTNQRPAVTTLEAAKDEFRKAIGDRYVLIVIDDAWKSEHVTPFLSGGPNCAYLITTRNSNALPDKVRFTQNLDAMKPSEATQLLRAGLPDSSTSPFEMLAKRLGEWPLLLKLANGALRQYVLQEKKSLANALTYVDKALTRRGLVFFDRENPTERSQAVSATLRVSMDLLKEDEQRLYDQLAIFPEDVDVPLATLQKLWGLDDFDTEEFCRKLMVYSLLLNFDLQSIRLHDVVRRYLRDTQRQHLAMWHGAFLDAYGLAEWSALPESEPYLWRWLLYHLYHSGRTQEQQARLFNFQWLQTKLQMTDILALITDCIAAVEQCSQVERTDERYESLRLLNSALGMSAHVLAANKSQLAAQLIGRLKRYHHYPMIDTLLGAAKATKGTFLPMPQASPALTPAGSLLLRTFQGHTRIVRGALQLTDGHILSWANDNTLRLWSSDGTPLAILEGHTDSVRGALQLTDGHILSWAGEHTLRLWTSDGTPLATLEGHIRSVSGALQLTDGHILSWAYDNTLRLWTSDGTPLATLKGHTDSVRGALQLTDGHILSWADDNTLRLWTSDGTPLAILEGHTDSVSGALQLTDGHILSWADDRTLRLWTSDGTPLATLEGHTGRVSSALQLTDGHILSWAYDNTLRLWTSDGTPLATLEGHTDSVRGALQLTDGHILSWADDNTLRLWTSDGTPLATLEGHIRRVSGALQLTDGRLLSWAYEGTLRLWTSDGTPLATLEGHTDSVNGALQLTDGHILSWADDRTLRLWTSDGTPLATLEGHTDSVRGALQLTDGHILSWADDHTLRLWSSDGTPLATLEGHTGRVSSALQLTDGRLLSWADDNTLRLWTSDGTPLATLEGHTDSVRGALQLTDGHILSWADDHTLRLWTSDGTPLATLEGHTDSVRGALQLTDGRLLSWAYEGTLRLWTSDGTPLATLEGYTDSVRGALQLTDGRLLSWADDRTLRLWTSDGTPLATLEGHTGRVSSALQLTDGRLLSWADDNTLRLWSSDGTPLATLEGHTDSMNGALQLTDGHILSWADDNTLRLWTSDGTPLATLKGHIDFVINALQLTDGRLLSWAYDSTLRLWTSDGTPLTIFYSDAPITCCIVLTQSPLYVVAGDSQGRILFLELAE